MSSRVRFVLSVCPSVCGWKAVDMDSLTPVSLNSVRQNLLVNFVSRSDMMAFGSPCSRNMLSKNSLAVFGAVVVVSVGIRCTIFDSRSTTTRMASCPFLVSGSCVMKSMEIISQGRFGMGSGCNRPGGSC